MKAFGLWAISCLLGLAVCLMNLACGAARSSSGPTISGSVQTNGPVSGATVTASDVNQNDGSTGATLGTATTDSSGNFTVMLTSVPAGAVRLTASGGMFKSQADGSTGNSGSISESALLDTVTPPMSGVAVTPLTEFVNSLTVGALTGVIPARRFFPTLKPNLAITFSGAHAQANSMVAKFYGLTPTALTENITPSYTKGDIAANSDGFTAGVVISTLAGAGKENASISSTPDKLITALSQDFGDGVLDGKISSTSGAVMLGGAPLPPTTGTTDFLFATNDCVGSNLAAASCAWISPQAISPGDVIPIIRKIGTGASSSSLSPRAFGMTPGSSAAIATISFNGHQYVIIAGRTKGIIVLDVTDPANVTAKAWACLSTDTFSSNFVGGVVPVVGTAPHPQILAYAFALPDVALINAEVLATGTPPAAGLPCPASLVDSVTVLTITNPPPNFSDISTALIFGGMPDNGNKGVWIATADGYELFDLSTNALSTSVPAFPVDSGQQLAENMGGDIAHNQILAGNYVGMQLIDLSLAKSFDMNSAFFNANIAPLATGTAALFKVDQTSVDTTLQVAVGTAEHVANSFFINTATLSETSSNSTFVPGANGFASVQMSVNPLTGLDLTGSSADPSSHMVFFSGDNTSWIAVGQLQDPATVAAGSSWLGMTDWVMWNLVNSPSVAVGADTYFGSSDPHVFGRMYNVSAGKPFAYLLNSDDLFVVQVDMQGLFNLARSTVAGDPDAAHKPAADPGLSPGIFRVITGY